MSFPFKALFFASFKVMIKLFVTSLTVKMVALLSTTTLALADDERYSSSSSNNIFAVYFPGNMPIGNETLPCLSVVNVYFIPFNVITMSFPSITLFLPSFKITTKLAESP